MKKEIVIILSHADTTDKLEVLDQCITEARDQGFDIILSSHIQVPEKYYDIVDFVIYDKDNPIIYYSEFPNAGHVMVWSDTAEYSQVYPFEFDHSYAVLKLVKNGIGVAYANGYEKAHYINYDYVIKNKNLLKQHSIELDSYDIYSYYFDAFDSTREHINAGLFSVKVKPFIEASLNIKDREDFIGNHDGIFEKFLYTFYHEKCGLTLDYKDHDVLVEGNVINSKSTFKNVVDNKIACYLAYEESTDNYYSSIKVIENVNIEVVISTDGIKKHFTPVPHVQYVIDITDYIKSGKDVTIEIPQYGFIDIYKISTHHATCNVKDRNIIKQLSNIS